MIVEAASFLEDACELHAAGTHVFDVGLRAGVSVLEGSLFFAFAPEDFIIAVAVERRIDVDQINAVIGQLGELFEIVTAIDNAGVEQSRRSTRRSRRGMCTLGRIPLFRHSLNLNQPYPPR